MNIIFIRMKKAINKKRNGFIYQLQQSCNTPLHEMEIDVARYSVLSRVHGCRDGACVNATPTTCRGKSPSKGGDVDERWKIFFGFSPLNFYSNPIVCLTPYVVTLIGLRCLFWRQRHDDVMLRGNRKFLPTTI